MIYLASPYTHPDPKVQATRAHLATIFAAGLTMWGSPAFSPVAYGALLSLYYDLPGDFEYWRAFNDQMIEACDEVIVLELTGWELSRGVAHEIAVAARLGKPVSYMKFDF